MRMGRGSLRLGAEESDRRAGRWGDILGSFDARCAHRLSGLLLPAGFWHEQEGNERLTIMKWGRIAAAKRLLRDIVIAANVGLNIMNHFHRITAHNHPSIF